MSGWVVAFNKDHLTINNLMCIVVIDSHLTYNYFYSTDKKVIKKMSKITGDLEILIWNYKEWSPYNVET